MKLFPQWLNRFFVYLQLNEVKGKYRFYLLTAKLFKHFVIKHQVGQQAFYVPYDQWCFWKNYGPNNYYLEEMLPFTDFINRNIAAFDFIDLGADIGTVSGLVKKHCPQLQQIIALEPNPSSFNILKHNHQLPAQVFNYAVSDFDGTCQFNFESEQASDHEGHIDPSKQGSTQVYSLDSLIEKNHMQLSQNIVIKIDVEGQEQAVFRGAKNTVMQADNVIVLLELHPDTLARDGLTAEGIFKEAEAVTNFKWLVPLLDNKEVNREIPFFEQFPTQQYDVIGIAVNDVIAEG